jgi:hypothetical protein
MTEVFGMGCPLAAKYTQGIQYSTTCQISERPVREAN